MLKTNNAESKPTIRKVYSTNPQIESLLKVEGTHRKPVQEGDRSLQIWKRGKSSLCFYGNVKLNGSTINHPLGSYVKPNKKEGVEGFQISEAIAKWVPIKKWVRKNNRHPKEYGNIQLDKGNTPFEEVVWKYWDSAYRDNLKEGTSRNTRENRLKRLIEAFGANTPICDFEVDRNGVDFVESVFDDLWVSREREASGQINRRILNNLFKWAALRKYLSSPIQNPCSIPFEWEKRAHTNSKKRPTLAKSIKNGSWGEVPAFVASLSTSTNKTSGREVGVDHIVKNASLLHLLFAIRSGVVVRLKWDWFNKEKDWWEIPSQTAGLKRQALIAGTEEDLDHIIPNTPQIQKIIDRMYAINGDKEYVFYSPFNRKNQPHITSESIWKHFTKDLGWAGEQTPHGWRSVITTGTKEFGDHIKPEVMDRQLDHFDKHIRGSIGHYDDSTLLQLRREFMEWWSKTCVNELGLII